MIFLDLLDSAKSAHTKKYVNEWWRPDSEAQQMKVVEMARAEMMMRILHGDTVVLSDNQAVDSVAWMKIATKFCELRLPWKPVAIAFSNKQQATSYDAITAILINRFTDDTYKFSSWVGLDNDLRAGVARNLNRVGNNLQIGDMLNGLISSIPDQHLVDELMSQVAGLQSFYEYLKQNEYSNVSFPAEKVGNQIWARLLSLKDLPNGISSKTLKFMKKVASSKVEYRSALYDALEQMDIDEQSRVRKIVDRYYNEKMGYSVAEGKGVYTTVDFNPNTSLENDMKFDIQADKFNGENGLLGRVVLEIHPEKMAEYLGWDEFEQVLKDEKFQAKAWLLRARIKQYDDLNPNDPEYFAKYRNWLGETIDVLESHHEFLAESLGGRVVQKESRKFKAFFAPGLGSSIAGTAAGLYLGSFFGEPYGTIVGGIVGGFIGNTGYDLLKDRALPFLKLDNAVGSVRTALKDAAKIKGDEKLLK
ncbi:MAG: hypothetical protein ACOYYU_05405 [Chloroflexota bacterium]